MFEALMFIFVITGTYFLLKAIWNYEMRVAKQK